MIPRLFLLLFTLVACLPTSRAAAPTFQRGASIAHWLAKVYPPAVRGGDWFNEEDVRWIAAQGFDHLRVAVDTRDLFDAEGHLLEPPLVPFLQALELAQRHGLGVVLDAHFLPGGRYDHGNQDPAVYTDPGARRAAALAWAALAQRFQTVGDELRFELINEPFAPTDEDLNVLTAELIQSIRAVDTKRFLYVTCNLSSTFLTLPNLRVPADPRTGVIVHYDEPGIFTHQRASWKDCPPDMKPVPFPGQVPDFTRDFPAGHFAHEASGRELTVAEIDAAFARAAAWLREHAPGREVYLGEFGVYEKAPADSQARYIRAVRQAAERHGWGWAIWSYNGGFAVRTDAGEPTAVLTGLFRD